MFRRVIIALSAIFLSLSLQAQRERIVVPELPSSHPVMVDVASYDASRLAPKVDVWKSRPDELVGRLQMYWDSHADEIYIAGEQLDHVAGHAPVPTVRYTATRGTLTDYARPALEDIPLMQDSLGMWMRDRNSGEYGWVDPRLTGRNVENINLEIMRLARDAALLYNLTGDDGYARLAAEVFDTYMTGLYYREVPVDILHTHQQTLVGLTSMEVIHEDTALPAAECYDLLYNYLRTEYPSKISIYEGTFRKWCDVIIAGGVPHNNWDLIQARFVLEMAIAIGDRSYVDRILNEDSIRQWSIGRLIEYGFDMESGLWKESPNYSSMVMNEFSEFRNTALRVLGIDIADTYPILRKAILTLPQYCFPNGVIAAWGDSGYERPRSGFFIDYDAPMDDYRTPVFWSEGVSWFAARTGNDPRHSLMVSLVGSEGNHMHANGLSMEIYGRGYVQGIDPGKGAGYGTLDHNEYYAQFPAHNTVCVDGVSSYPTMQSHHPASFVGSYPDPSISAPAGGKAEPWTPGVIYGELSFLEPETQADQLRQLIMVGEDYYVDVFRSRRRDGRDAFHDYFYHNIGKEFTLDLPDMRPTEELSFAGAYLGGYSYLWDKSCSATAEDVRGRFEMKERDGTAVGMRMWMRGSDNRKLFKALSPKINSFTRTPVPLPYDVNSAPCQTFVARQAGEAWNHPFFVIYQPFADGDADGIKDVSFNSDGARITMRSGREDHIFSSDSVKAMSDGKAEVDAHIAVVSEDRLLAEDCLSVKAPYYSVKAAERGRIVLARIDGEWYYTADVDFKLALQGKRYRLKPAKHCIIK